MYTMNDKRITLNELQGLLECVDKARIGLIGDLCLDMYWIADMKLSELSRETPHYPLPIIEERYSPGGAGNVICNIAALKPEKLLAVGVIGEDWRGNLLLETLRSNGIDCSYMIRDKEIVTNTYIKPHRHGISNVVYEDPRLDFENRKPISKETEQKLLKALDEAAQKVDVICVCDQMKYGCITPAIREKLCNFGKNGKTIIVDSRDHSAEYTYVTVKPNEVEASRAFGDGKEMGLNELSNLAQVAAEHTSRIALMTLGDRGCFVASGKDTILCPACFVEPPIDFCGAGDTFLAGYATLIAAGATELQAAQIANLCSSITIKKIGTTGTATREEVIATWTDKIPFVK